MSVSLSSLDKKKCAVIVVDMQSDFIAEGAPIECPGGREIIPNIDRLLKVLAFEGIEE